jgi:hypothetical protein
MKDKTVVNIIMVVICFTVWTILSKYVGFESTVLIALATIYVTQK